MTNFQYNIGINQKAAIDSNLEIDIIDIAIMDFLWNFQASNKIKKIEGGWFWAAGSEIIKQIPILGIKTTRGISKRINKLVAVGLLERHPDNRQMRQSFYKITPRYETLFRFATRNQSSKHLEPEFQVTRNESSDYYNTIDNNTNNIKEIKEKTPSLSLVGLTSSEEEKPKFRAEDVDETYEHFYTLFKTETKYKYKQDSKDAITYWLKQGYTAQELQDSASVFKSGMDDKFGKSAKYFYGCKKNGKDYALFKNFLDVSPTDELDDLTNKIDALFDEVNMSKENRARVMNGQYPDFPWEKDQEAKEIARKIFNINKKTND